MAEEFAKTTGGGDLSGQYPDALAPSQQNTATAPGGSQLVDAAMQGQSGMPGSEPRPGLGAGELVDVRPLVSGNEARALDGVVQLLSGSKPKTSAETALEAGVSNEFVEAHYDVVVHEWVPPAPPAQSEPARAQAGLAAAVAAFTERGQQG